MIDLTSLLAICQQTEYDWRETAAWWNRHRDETLSIVPQRWTLKLKLLRAIALLLFFLPLPQRLRVGLSCLAPFDALVRVIIVRLAAMKLRRLQRSGLVVVAIAGSYGKTSTKHILAHVLQQFEETVMTPDSYNTPLGIASVIRSQLTEQTRVFAVELGEHYQGDIAKLCRWIQPDYGIVTPFGRQHLERMGSEVAIAHTVGELAEYLQFQPQKCLLHESFQPIWPDKSLLLYGASNAATYRVVAAKVTLAGTEFSAQVPGAMQPLTAFSPLFGEHQALNTLPAMWFAMQRGHAASDVVKAIASIPYIARRHEPTFLEKNVIVLDNSYNTNPESAIASLGLLKSLPVEHRFAVTMGFVELGDQSESVHEEFGKQLATTCEAIGLIESLNTAAIRRGFIAAGGSADRVVVAKDQLAATQALQPFFRPNSVVLLEGGFQEMYA